MNKHVKSVHFDPVVVAFDESHACGGFQSCLDRGMACTARGCTLQIACCTHCSSLLCEAADVDFTLPARLVTCNHCSCLVFLEDMAGVAANPLAHVLADSAWAQVTL